MVVRGKREKSVLQFMLINFGILYIFVSMLILMSVIKLSVQQTCYFSYTYIIYFLIYILSSKNVELFSMNMFILYYMVVQGFGYSLAFLFDYESTYLGLMRDRMFYGEYFDKYTALSILAITGILIGMAYYNKTYLISNQKKKSPNFYLSNEAISNDGNVENYYYVIGTTMLALFCIYMSVSLILGKIPLSNYNAYKEWAGNRMRNYLQIGYWFGVIFVISSSSKEKLLLPFILFIIPSVILMVTGNRNDFLFPLLIGIGVYNLRFKKVPKLLVILSVIFVFVISPIIATTRATYGFYRGENDLLKLTASSLREFGAQLRPISHMFSWLDYGERFAYGRTYLFSSLATIFGTIDSEYRDMYRRSRFCIEERLPALAFTMSGEVYFNFGILGVILVYLIIGYKMRKKESVQKNVDSIVKHAFYCFSLLFLVRNSFSGYIAIVFLFYALYFFEKIIRVLLSYR